MTILVALLTISIAGCGASGGDPLRSSNGTNLKIEAVSGVYDTSRSDDEAYLYISSTGEVIAYDYQNDARGTGFNCYSMSTSSDQINASLNSGTITYSITANTYTITSGLNVLEFTYDDTNGMQNFLLNSTLSGLTGLDVVASNLNIKIGEDGQHKSSILISDIEAALCN